MSDNITFVERSYVDGPLFGKRDSFREETEWEIDDVQPGACRHNSSYDRENDRGEDTLKTHGALDKSEGVLWLGLPPETGIRHAPGGHVYKQRHCISRQSNIILPRLLRHYTYHVVKAWSV